MDASFAKARKRKADGSFLPTHGGKKTQLYSVWCAMLERCNNPHNRRYSRYGGRGITVCDAWHDFSAFRSWALENGYVLGLTIDRVDNDRGYSPVNCRWVTRAEQNRNYSRNHMITYRGETKCLSDLADQYGINRATVLWRLKAGKPLDEVFKKYDGRTKQWKTTISEN